MLSLEECELKDVLAAYCKDRRLNFISFLRDFRRANPNLALGPAIVSLYEKLLFEQKEAYGD